MNRVISYKYPQSIGTMYKQDFKMKQGHGYNCDGTGRQPQFILDKEKRNVKIKFDPPMELKTTKEMDYRPFVVKSSN